MCKRQDQAGSQPEYVVKLKTVIIVLSNRTHSWRTKYPGKLTLNVESTGTSWALCVTCGNAHNMWKHLMTFWACFKASVAFKFVFNLVCIRTCGNPYRICGNIGLCKQCGNRLSICYIVMLVTVSLFFCFFFCMLTYEITKKIERKWQVFGVVKVKG